MTKENVTMPQAVKATVFSQLCQRKLRFSVAYRRCGRKSLLQCFTMALASGFLAAGAVALGGTYTPTPDPSLAPASIIFNGNSEYGSVSITITEGAVISVSASSSDYDTLTNETSSTDADGAEIVWSTSGGGSISSSRSGSGQSITFTAPTLGENETSRSVSITAQPDDDSTSDPGDPLNGNSGNRNDQPATGLTLALLVVKECKVTKITTANDYVKIGSDVTFTAEGVSLDKVSWTGGGAPSTGTGTTFTSKWTASGSKTVTAACGQSSQSKTVKVVAVTGLTMDAASDGAWLGTNNSVCAVKTDNKYIVLKATTDPNEPGAWDLIDWDNGSAGATANQRKVPEDYAGKLNVTATVGTSSKSITTVVVWVTMTDFDTTGPVPADAEGADLPPEVFGVPDDRALNGVLMQFTVNPVDAYDYGIRFDIKRTKETRVWGLTSDDYEWYDGGGDVAGTNDDSAANLDEDLTPSAEGHIYASDAPGKIAEVPSALTVSFVYVGSFVEWVTVTNAGGKNCSDNFPWHTFVWADNDEGVWKRNNTVIDNEITIGAATINRTDPPPMW